jgi:polyribonucleotide nucleotidyltransferase
MNLKEYYKEILNNLLSEDVQTPERQAQMKRKYNKAERSADAAEAIVQKKTKVEDRAYGKYSIRRPGSIARLHNAIKRADFARDDREELENKLSDIVNQNDKERKSRKLFGKGGKIVKEDTETPLRNAENNKAIANLARKEVGKLETWSKLPRGSKSRTTGLRQLQNAQDAAVKIRDRKDRRIALQKKEQQSTSVFGLGGKRRKTK